MLGFAHCRFCKLAGGNKYSFRRCIQRSAKAVDFNASNRMTPAFNLKLNVRFGKEIICIWNVSVNVNSTVLRGGRNGNVFEPVCFNNSFYKMLKPIRINLEQMRTQFFYFVIVRAVNDFFRRFKCSYLSFFIRNIFLDSSKNADANSLACSIGTTGISS